MLARNAADVQHRAWELNSHIGLLMRQVKKADSVSERIRSGAQGTQTIQRASLLMRLLASRSRSGLRLADVVQDSGLEHPTAHRILKGLMAEGLVMQDAGSRRYLIGPLVYELGLAAAPQF